MNFSGHGGRAFLGAPFSIKLFSEDVLNFMEENKIERANVLGYSMGGYVALNLARHFPGKLLKIITLATKFHWDEATAAREIQMLNPDKIEMKVPGFAEILKNRHSPNDWKEVLRQATSMLVALG